MQKVPYERKLNFDNLMIVGKRTEEIHGTSQRSIFQQHDNQKKIENLNKNITLTVTNKKGKWITI